MPTLVQQSALPSWIHAIARHRALLVPVAFVSLLVVIVVPLPAFLLDALISTNIALSVVVLLTTIYMREPLDFSVFPSLLLGATLLRLVLNVASTRLILSADAASPEAAADVAGHVISAFGHFVAGDSLAVGIIIFLILVIVQFVVITKGATRISEVAARFTLDAMPGKQMAIDADLNAGIINEQEARRRRERIAQEADFYGAMDGASKFVRGDAVAGLIITLINVAGGFAIGALSKGWPAGQTAKVFTTLTIGDGLAAQIPAFTVAVASALIVTRSSSKERLGTELTSQLFSQPMGLGITAAFLLVLVPTPLPNTPLLFAAAVLSAVAFALRRQAAASSQRAAENESRTKGTVEPPTPEALLKLDTLELEVGYGLVSLVDAGQGGDLLERIAAIRRQLAVDLGFIMPPVRIRDNMTIQANEYRLKIRGSVVAQGQVVPGRLLAMDPGVASGRIEGVPTREPAFGLPAWWIEPAVKNRAESLNYTVVEPSAVLATHLTEVVRQHAAELLTREEVNNLVAQLKERAPKLVEEVVPSIVKPGELQKVLQNLLRERVSIKDLESVLETLSDWGPKTKDLDVLTEYARNSLRRSICQQYATPVAPDAGAATANNSRQQPAGGAKVVCITLDPAFEDLISGYIDRSAGGTVVTMPAAMASACATQLARALQPVIAAGQPPVVIASPPVRAVVRQILEPHVPAAAVLGYNEIVPEVELESLALVTPPALAQGRPAAAA